MLRPDEICLLTIANGRAITLECDEAAWGKNSGAQYVGPGSVRLASADRDGHILVFRQKFPVAAEVPFLGRIPTAENVYVASVCVWFRFVNPSDALQSLPFSDSVGRRCVKLNDFAVEACRHVRAILRDLASEFSVQALVGGPAVPAGVNRLAEELNRVYAFQGLEVDEEDQQARAGGGHYRVVLQRIEDPREEAQLKHILARIDFEAEQQERLQEAEREQFLAALYEAQKKQVAEEAKKGNDQAERLATQLATIDSYAELRKQVQEAFAGDAKAAVVTAPVLMNTEEGVAGNFAVLSSGKDPQYYQILRDWFTLGREADCHVRLRSEIVSGRHATVARVGSGLLVVDRSSRNGTWYNGERILQRFLHGGDVLRIGDFWVVFKLEACQELRALDRSVRDAIRSSKETVARTRYGSRPGLGNGLRDEVSALVQLYSSAGRTATSDSRPILIGHDATCDLQLAGGGVARFHAVVYWDVVRDGGENVAGVFVEDLHSGRGLLRQGQPIRRAKLEHGDVLEIGGHRITVSFVGDVGRRAQALYSAQPTMHGIAIVCIEGPSAGASFRLGANAERVVIGRAHDCDFRLNNCPKVSNKHAEILRRLVECRDGSRRPEFRITDLSSRNGTLLNGRRLEPAQAEEIHPGDIIRLSQGGGHCDLLVHYDL